MMEKEKLAQAYFEGWFKTRKRSAAILAVIIIGVVAFSSFAALETYNQSAMATKKPFYCGVTYCGNSTTEAEQLIDKVKGYTNLFVLQSGPLMLDVNATEQIGDYAVSSGLNFIFYYGNSGDTSTLNTLLNMAQARWGNRFLGVYYQDEPGGKMLDDIVNFDLGNNTNAAISKDKDGTVYLNTDSSSGQNSTFTIYGFRRTGELYVANTSSYYSPSNLTQTSDKWNSAPTPSDGTPQSTIIIWPLNDDFSTLSTFTDYYPNGTITYQFTNNTFDSGLLTYLPNGTVTDANGTVVTNQGDISQFTPYQHVWDQNMPIQTYAQAAQAYLDSEQNVLGSVGNQSAVNLFTSDYGLYWFDYQSGYNTVFAELDGNETNMQTIALARGAAEINNKNWGAMITWGCNAIPGLPSGDVMYNEIRQAYQSGATYVVVFNYSPSGNGMGLMQDQHFAALQKFWSDVVENPKITNNVTAKGAFILPENFGGGLRNENDSVWGIWQANAISQQTWNNLQAALNKYGSNLDVIYDSSVTHTASRYQQVIYWNQTA